MMFQIFASLVLGGIIVYAYAQARTAPVIAAVAIVIALGGEYLVLLPSHAIAIAKFFGIGRGADLINYLWMLLSLVVVLNLHLRLRASNARLVALTRALALDEVGPVSESHDRLT